MSRHDRQLAKHRGNFERALKHSRCPKCKGHVLEVVQPDVVCEKCGNQFILAIQSGTFTMRSKLIEKKTTDSANRANQSPTVGERFCHKCGAPASEGSNFCNKCGAQLS